MLPALPSHSNYRFEKELLCLKEIIDKDNAPENSMLSVDSHPAQIFDAKSAEEKSSGAVALIFHEHLHIPSPVLALVSLQEVLLPPRPPAQRLLLGREGEIPAHLWGSDLTSLSLCCLHKFC